EGVELMDPVKARRIGPEEVMEKFGVTPDKVIDVQALAGDSVDNVPGVPGIGVKTAAQLLDTYGDLETLLEKAEEIKQPKRRENLIAFADQARVSKLLVTLKDDVEVPEPLSDFAVRDPEAGPLVGFLKAMEFTTLTKRIAGKLDADAGEIAATAEFAADPDAAVDEAPPVEAGAPGAAAGGQTAPIDTAAYETVTDMETLDRWIARCFAAGVIAVDTETDSLDAASANLVGVSLATGVNQACYIPLAHRAGDGLDLDGNGDAPKQLDRAEVLDRLRPLLADPATLKVGQNIKYDLLVLARHGVEVAPYDDTMLISYTLEAGAHGHGMDELSKLHLDHAPIPFKEIAGSGKSAKTFDLVPIADATRYAAEDADVTLRLWNVLKPRLLAERKVTVYETLERPMARVLAGMEREGVKVDVKVLNRLSNDFAKEMARLEEEIFTLAGERFTIGSPKQLGEILFGKMGLASAKKTATGQAATGADVLEELAAQGHDLPARVLDWRQVSKLKSTYTDALPTYINKETGRVHTSYSLAATTTGRLASSEPNLQNIPIRTDMGREIRTAFIAEPGNVLISADYSQIELRLLAHIADIPQLKTAFADGLDIHALTASEMFGVPVEGMDPSVRRRAKAINFGIIYGISAFGLANQLHIPQEEARTYIARYFERFPGIRTYMDETKAFAREHGYVETIFGRRIHVRGIDQKQPSARAFAERAAINAPIQGAAADIIRRAMIRLPGELAAARLKARMLLQVHDELIFEVPEDEADKTAALVKRVMEGATLPARQLSVPLTVETGRGANWDAAH
ncbi:MAG: DNA polymerase I, partial [Alphaproteobacteria bacterium]|nr:DNA polymerase I [Alphaproteobacteria bacterium]MDX5370016.1 DNA polymerase I [Alphaproteobacteria bacterium]MDX5464594.1 DNA polymerase I [Alphaproteobacteria bacterium]